MPIDRKSIRTLLQNAKRPVLADILGKLWDLPLVEHADAIWETPGSHPPMEKEILESFESEFCRIGLTREQAKEYCSSLQKTRILQTATHSTATEGPTFLALHYLALMGLPPRETYFVGAYSGVSFANSAWSGCLNYSNRFDLGTIISYQATEFARLKRSDADRSRD